jgi:hypothetical protein
VWWGGNAAINLHREGSIELIMLALDYWEHTGDEAELKLSILPLATAVVDWVRTFFGRTAGAHKLDVWPTQSLEGYRCTFPPTRESCVNNDMPIVAGLHAVLPRLLHLAATAPGARLVNSTQAGHWQQLLSELPALPVVGNTSASEVFTAAQFPLAPNATHSGSESPMMYPVHPYRLSTVLSADGEFGLLKTGKNTYTNGHGYNGNTGWKQGVINAAYLGMAGEAQRLVVERAQTGSGAMRFQAYLPDMQDFRPNEDHLSNMRVGLQGMLVQHGDHGSTSANEIALLPAWPCSEWSVDFKVHLPGMTTLQGSYNHTTRVLEVLSIEPAARRGDVRILSCVDDRDVVWRVGC